MAGIGLTLAALAVGLCKKTILRGILAENAALEEHSTIAPLSGDLDAMGKADREQAEYRARLEAGRLR